MNKGLEALEKLSSKLLIEEEQRYLFLSCKDTIEAEIKRLEEDVEIEQNNEQFWKQECMKLDKILRIIKEKLDANTICRVFGFKGYEIIKYFADDDLLKEYLK